MELADEITDFVRDYFETYNSALTTETDLVAAFATADPDRFADFLEDVSQRFGIRHRELRDMSPGADTRPPGVLTLLRDVFLWKTDMEIVCVDRLTIGDLCEIARLGIWPEHFIRKSSDLPR